MGTSESKDSRKSHLRQSQVTDPDPHGRTARGSESCPPARFRPVVACTCGSAGGKVAGAFPAPNYRFTSGLSVPQSPISGGCRGVRSRRGNDACVSTDRPLTVNRRSGRVSLHKQARRKQGSGPVMNFLGKLAIVTAAAHVGLYGSFILCGYASWLFTMTF